MTLSIMYVIMCTFCHSKGDVVALKKLKMEKEREGFPITSLREINMLLKSSHPNIVHVRVCTHYTGVCTHSQLHVGIFVTRKLWLEVTWTRYT